MKRKESVFWRGLRRAVLWATGRDLMDPSLPVLPPQFEDTLGYWKISGPPEPLWEMTLSADAHLKFSLPEGPNVLHRLAQRLVLGIRWRMLPETNKSIEKYSAQYDARY